MNNHSTEEYAAAIQTINSTIANCEKAQLKFKAGTSQHSLLKNRLNALKIVKSLLINDESCQHQNDEIRQALPPILSIISKCEKAQQKYEEGSVQYRRYVPLLHTMKLSLSLIEEQLKHIG